MKFPKLVSRRMFLIGFTASLCLFALVIYRRSAEWNKIRNELISKGEILRLSELYYKRIPDTQNFAFTPSLIDLRINAEKRTQIASIIDWNQESRYDYQFSETEIETAKTANLSEYLAYLSGATPGSPPPVETNLIGTEILQRIGRRDSASLLTELDSRIESQDSQLIPTWSEYPKTNLRFEYLTTLLSLSRTLNLRATAASRTSDSAIAMKSIASQIQLVSAMTKEPFMVPVSETITAHRQMTNALWENLTTRKLDAEGLKTIQNLLSRINLGADLPYHVRTELLLTIDDDAEIILDTADTEPKSDLTLSSIIDLVYWVIRDTNHARKSKWYFEDFIRPLEKGLPNFASGLDASIANRQEPVSFITELVEIGARTSYPVWFGIARRVIVAEAFNRLAITSCALERHAISHGSYPNELAELAPNFLPEVPKDPIDGSPIRYLKDDTNGRYKLYSIGMDAVDHGGATHINDGENYKTRFQEDDYIGDWTWRYPEL